jgi:Tol biopolymer transport system component
MSELREVFEMVTKQTEPDVDAWKDQERRQRKANRSKKIGAIAVAAAFVIALVAIGISTQGSDDVRPANSGSNPTVAPGEAEQELSIVDVGTGTATAFTAPPGASDFDFAVSRSSGTWMAFTLDGSMVAYSDLDENGNAQVFVMDANGSNVRQLTHGEGGVGDYGGFDWSPDGSMIAYERDTADGPQIFTVRVSDGVSTRVTNAPRGAVGPGGWAPDGGSIIFSTINTAGNHYTAQSLDLTTGQTRLIVPDGSTPELSPDGAWIAFNSWLKPDPLVRLMLANSDGSERRLIARLSGDDGYEQWSPDSTQIAFVGSTDADGSGTYVYDLATGETRFVTDGTIESWVDNDHILVS